MNIFGSNNLLEIQTDVKENETSILNNTNNIEKAYLNIPYMETSDPSYTITNSSYPLVVPSGTLSHDLGTNTSYFSSQAGAGGNKFIGSIHRFRIYKNSDTKIFDSKDNANFRTSYDGTQTHTESIFFPSFIDTDFLYFDIELSLGPDSDGHCALFYVNNSYQLMVQLYPMGNFSTTQTSVLFISHDLVSDYNNGLGQFDTTVPALGGNNFENYGKIKVGERKRFIIRLDYRTAGQITYQTKEHIISSIDGKYFFSNNSNTVSTNTSEISSISGSIKKLNRQIVFKAFPINSVVGGNNNEVVTITSASSGAITGSLNNTMNKSAVSTNTTFYVSNAGFSTGIYTGSESLGGETGWWIKYELKKALSIYGYSLRVSVGNNLYHTFPREFVIMASNDNSNWTTLFSQNMTGSLYYTTRSSATITKSANQVIGTSTNSWYMNSNGFQADDDLHNKYTEVEYSATNSLVFHEEIPEGFNSQNAYKYIAIIVKKIRGSGVDRLQIDEIEFYGL